MAIEALPDDVTEAGARLKAAALQRSGGPLDTFYGLVLDDDFDNTCEDKTDYPLGLEWCDVLYFALKNREQFAVNR
jgi:hypothetical protein